MNIATTEKYHFCSTILFSGLMNNKKLKKITKFTIILYLLISLLFGNEILINAYTQKNNWQNLIGCLSITVLIQSHNYMLLVARQEQKQKI